MKNNKNYREIKNKIHKIMDRNLNIQKLLDETYLENGLNAGECKGLSQIIVLYNNLQDILEKYNPDNLFKKQKSEILNLENNTITEETAIIEYKEKNFLKKIFDKIKHLFKKN